MAERNQWILHIKRIRTAHGCDIAQAERIALADPAWRRWVERQINSDIDCHRMAERHICHRGDDALIEREDDYFRLGR